MSLPLRPSAVPSPPPLRGKKSRRWPRTAAESSRVLRQSRGAGLAWRRECRPPASAAARAARRSWRPSGVHGDITPAAAGDQDVEDSIGNLPT
jgi:hypothetical protein